MTNFNPANIERAVRGINFPVDKEAILAKAKENNAKQEEMTALETLPEREYTTPAEITEALSEDGSNEM